MLYLSLRKKRATAQKPTKSERDMGQLKKVLNVFGIVLYQTYLSLYYWKKIRNNPYSLERFSSYTL